MLTGQLKIEWILEGDDGTPIEQGQCSRVVASDMVTPYFFTEVLRGFLVSLGYSHDVCEQAMPDEPEMSAADYWALLEKTPPPPPPDRKGCGDPECLSCSGG